MTDSDSNKDLLSVGTTPHNEIDELNNVNLRRYRGYLTNSEGYMVWLQE